MNTRQHLYRGFHPCDNGSQTITLDGKQIKGEWVEGSYFHDIDHRFGVTSEEDYIIGFDRYADIMENIEVLPETVCEWTGKVCNGAKVYEDDIIETHYTDEEGEIVERAVIRWNNDKAMYEAVIRTSGREVVYSFDDVMAICDNGEIVGNIFTMNF